MPPSLPSQNEVLQIKVGKVPNWGGRLLPPPGAPGWGAPGDGGPFSDWTPWGPRRFSPRHIWHGAKSRGVFLPASRLRIRPDLSPH